MIDLKDLTLQDLLPEHLIQDGDVGILLEIMNEEIHFLNDIVTKQSAPDDLMDLPNEVIEHLLWEEHIYPNEGGYLAFTKAEKAELIRSAYDLHRKKGTVYAIERVLDVVGLNGEVMEWKEYDADPYHFIVELQPTGKFAHLDDVRVLIVNFKNTRSWFDGFVILTIHNDIFILNDSYQYPVYYETCGEFGPEAEFWQNVFHLLAIHNDSYQYPVHYDVYTQEVTQLIDGIASHLNDSYQYNVPYPQIDDMQPLEMGAQLQERTMHIEHQRYHFPVHYLVCGEFYCEE